MNEHISSAYDRDLEEIQTLVIKMGGLVEAAILNASEALAVSIKLKSVLKMRMDSLVRMV